MNETALLIEAITETNEILKHIYALQLLSVGSVCAVLVCILLYKFIRLFF